MDRKERILFESNRPEVYRLPEGLRVESKNYSIEFTESTPYAELKDENQELWTKLFLPGSISSTDAKDETLGFSPPSVAYGQSEIVISQDINSTIWSSKRMFCVCTDENIEIFYKITGNGKLESCKFFGGSFTDDKHSGEAYSSACFKSVFNPGPTFCERRTHPAGQYSKIGVTGNPTPGREGWFFSPAPYTIGFNKKKSHRRQQLPDGHWLMAGISTPIEEQNFTGMEYSGRERAFAINLSYEGMVKVEGIFQTPSLFLNFTEDPYQGLSAQTRMSESKGHLSMRREAVNHREWWSQPIFCGWGAQSERHSAEKSSTIQNYSRQELYDEFLSTLEEKGVFPGTIVIDDKWQSEYGSNQVDEEKWPDMERWIEQRHRLGQKVLLWLKAWDAEGLSPEMCVRTSDGRKVSADPSNPEYQDFIKNQVTHMLGTNGLNADGFKIDFTARTPSGSNLLNKGPEWGGNLLHKLLETIYTQAKTVKPESLIVTQTPNPWYRDVTDMIRLNDINFGTSVTKQMIHRANVVKAVCPELMIDTDNWPMPNRKQWRQYLKIQKALGVQALYFSSHVGGKRLREKDYDAIREAWEG